MNAVTILVIRLRKFVYKMAVLPTASHPRGGSTAAVAGVDAAAAAGTARM